MQFPPRIFLSVMLLAAPLSGADFAEITTPFLNEYCISCHGPEKEKGKLRLDMLGSDFGNPHTASKWAEVINALNGHEMPPEDEEKQPTPEASGKVVAWLEQQLAQAEIAKRSARVVLRRLNRAEYNNTIRDLVGVDFDPAATFPEDPPAGGFDNNGHALTISPLQMELYYAAARKILDHALVEGEQPPMIKWHFEPEENTKGGDRLRVKRDKFNILLNDGENPTENGFTVIHHDSWNKGIGFRDFRVPADGEYIIRFLAAGRVPTRAEVVEAAKQIRAKERDRRTAEKPKEKKHFDREYERNIQHFETHRMYDYGPPRVRVGTDLGGTPKTVAEMDIDAPESAPKIYEVRTRFTTEKAGVRLNYDYNIPKVLENFAIQDKEEFARPVLLVDWVELEGPIHPTWPPATHTRILFDSPDREKDPAAYARAVLTRFMTNAYRRPVTADEVAGKLALFEKATAAGEPFLPAIKASLAAVLTSPNFLYLVEPEAPAAQPRRLTAYELASRLSYFLWSSMPDAELFRVAQRGDLHKPAGMTAQVARMLKDPRSDAFVKNFAGQWLGLRKVGANPPAENLYPEYDRHAEVSMVRETEAFFAEILRHDLDVRNLIKSDFVTINERMARYYGIPGVKGDEFRRVPAPPDSHRGGLVTQASMHTITSNGTRTSPVLRGVWVLKTLLGTDPGLPVANVGEIATKVPGIDKATVRQRLEIHRENAACARCHDKIDPLGLALENFNAAGEWRDQEGHGYNGRIERDDPRIDARAKLPDGTEFDGVEGLQAALLKKDELFLNALASQLGTFALGRELGFSDRAAVRSWINSMRENRHTIRSLINAVVTSEQFTTK